MSARQVAAEGVAPAAGDGVRVPQEGSGGGGGGGLGHRLVCFLTEHALREGAGLLRWLGNSKHDPVETSSGNDSSNVHGDAADGGEVPGGKIDDEEEAATVSESAEAAEAAPVEKTVIAAAAGSARSTATATAAAGAGAGKAGEAKVVEAAGSAKEVAATVAAAAAASGPSLSVSRKPISDRRVAGDDVAPAAEQGVGVPAASGKGNAGDGVGIGSDLGSGGGGVGVGGGDSGGDGDDGGGGGGDGGGAGGDNVGLIPFIAGHALRQGVGLLTWVGTSIGAPMEMGDNEDAAESAAVLEEREAAAADAAADAAAAAEEQAEPPAAIEGEDGVGAVAPGGVGNIQGNGEERGEALNGEDVGFVVEQATAVGRWRANPMAILGFVMCATFGLMAGFAIAIGTGASTHGNSGVGGHSWFGGRTVKTIAELPQQLRGFDLEMYECGDGKPWVKVTPGEDTVATKFAEHRLELFGSIVTRVAKLTRLYPTPGVSCRGGGSAPCDVSSSGGGGSSSDSNEVRVATPLRLFKAFNSWTVRHRAAVEDLVDGPWV